MEVEHVRLEDKTQFQVLSSAPVLPLTLLQVPDCPIKATFGVMTYIAYKVVGSEEEIVVGTTRPETMLGDTGVAVHPEDQRYAHLIGRSVWHPVRGVAIPVVGDEGADPALGTGAVKITPAHDRLDWEVGRRHGLQVVTMMDSKGSIAEGFDQFSGQHRFEARETVVEELNRLGLLRGQEPHAMSVPVCCRTGDVVEPLVRPQWFLDTSTLAERAGRAVDEGRLVLEPGQHATVWQNLMGEGRDWCLSRQIWWGHRVPAYACTAGSEQCWVAAGGEEEARTRARQKLGLGEGEQVEVRQDEDVLDTWFSSGLYPFAALGWPEQSPDLKRFYPLDLMETGHDILFFWVGRMVMLGLALTHQLPFHKVLLHGVITDPEGRKMSKSLGNVIDPMNLIHGASLAELEAGVASSVAEGVMDQEEKEVALGHLRQQWPQGMPAHGVDPLRWALASYDVKQQQIAVEPAVVQAAGAWCNKVNLLPLTPATPGVLS